MDIQHHGIKGMHWGIRRYQPYPKGSKSKGKEVGEAAKKSGAKPKMTEEEAKAAYEKQKSKALKSGSARDILKFKGDLTNQEMRDAINRLDLEKKLLSYSMQNTKTAKKKVDDIMKDLNMINNWTNIGINTYNNFARVYNATEKGKKKQLSLIQGLGGGGNQKKK